MFALVLLLLASPITAWAYVDPGSGMMMWQGLIAAVGALLVVIRHPIQWVKGMWRRVFVKSTVDVRHEKHSESADKHIP